MMAIFPEERLWIVIKRETYMSRIRPFIGNDLVKVLTGIRRSGDVRDTQWQILSREFSFAVYKYCP